MKLIYICSPYAGDIETNTLKAREYCRWVCLYKKSVPIAPHLHNTQFLEDCVALERRIGIDLGLELLKKCDELWVFGNNVSNGMEQEIAAAKILEIPVFHMGENYWEVK